MNIHGIKEHTTFTTSDGQTFENIDEARRHQIRLNVKEAWEHTFPNNNVSLEQFWGEAQYPAKDLHRALAAFFKENE